MNDPATLIATYRIPLDSNRVGRLSRTLRERPDHWLEVCGVFLEVHVPERSEAADD